MSFEISCYHCQQSQTVNSLSLSFSEECPKCSRDLHACKQCRFYDSNAYNNCSEPQAERVVDKEKRNYCDYFQSKKSGEASAAESDNNSALKKLDDLFK